MYKYACFRKKKIIILLPRCILENVLLTMSDDKAENYGDCVYKRYSMWGNQFGQLIDGSKHTQKKKK